MLVRLIGEVSLLLLVLLGVLLVVLLLFAGGGDVFPQLVPKWRSRPLRRRPLRLAVALSLDSVVARDPSEWMAGLMDWAKAHIGFKH